MSSTNVHWAVEGPRATVTLESDKGICVLSSSVFRAMADALGKILEHDGVRCLVLMSKGKVFIAGADIKEMVDFTRDQAHAYGALGQSVFDKLEAMPCITVAAINGAAMGGGLEATLACDFRIAVASAKLALPEASLGLIPGWGGTRRLTKLIGPARAKRFFLGAKTVTAEEGLAMGLVDEIVETPDALDGAVDAFCKSFSPAAPQAVALAKRAVREDDDLTAFADCFETEDAREGIAAFLAKRPARWME